MQPPGFEDVFTLLASYVGKRPRRGPFPLESALTWSALLCTQSSNHIRGEMLEIGVEFGTSAFLMLESLQAGEHVTLIDLVKTDEWLEGINGPYRDQTAHTYIVGNTLDLAQADLPQVCRWIHIDGGHLYQHVANDLQLSVNLLAPEGVLVLDDFFEIRWPDVTRAILDFLSRDKTVIPFLLVNRKLYCAADADWAAKYKAVFASFLQNCAPEIGQVRWWDQVSMLGESVLVAKMELSERLTRLET